MIYTVGEMAKMLDVPASTLRYYDKEGLLPFVERSPGGIRMFQESDYGWLKIIIYRKREMDLLESDFDREIKRLKDKNDNNPN